MKQPKRQKQTMSISGNWNEDELLVVERFRKTAAEVRRVELLGTLTQMLTVTLGALLLGIIVDHGIGVHGLTRIGRYCFAGTLLLLLAFIFVRRLFLLIRYQINPLYVADVLEGNRKNSHNSLINWLLLRSDTPEEKTPIHSSIMEGVARRAAWETQQLPPETLVDYSAVIRRGIAFTTLFAGFLVYLVISTKSLFVSGERLLLPWADIAAPIAVRFDKISPEDVTVFAGESVEIEVQVRGIGNKKLFFSWSTLDRRLTDQKVEMLHQVGNHYSLTFPVSAEEPSNGLTESLEYRIAVGENDPIYSPAYKIEVRPPITILVEQVTLTFPEKNKEPTVQDSGDIFAPYKTKVELAVQSNTPMSKFFFLPGGRESSAVAIEPVQGDSTRGTIRFTLQEPDDSRYREITFQREDSYLVTGNDLAGNRAHFPASHKIRISEEPVTAPSEEEEKGEEGEEQDNGNQGAGSVSSPMPGQSEDKQSGDSQNDNQSGENGNQGDNQQGESGNQQGAGSVSSPMPGQSEGKQSGDSQNDNQSGENGNQGDNQQGESGNQQGAGSVSSPIPGQSNGNQSGNSQGEKQAGENGNQGDNQQGAGSVSSPMPGQSEGNQSGENGESTLNSQLSTLNSPLTMPIDPQGNPGDAFDKMMRQMQKSGINLPTPTAGEPSIDPMGQVPPKNGQGNTGAEEGVKGPSLPELPQGLDRKKGEVSPDTKDYMTTDTRQLPDNVREASSDINVVDDPDKNPQGIATDKPDSAPRGSNRATDQLGGNPQAVEDKNSPGAGNNDNPDIDLDNIFGDNRPNGEPTNQSPNVRNKSAPGNDESKPLRMGAGNPGEENEEETPFDVAIADNPHLQYSRQTTNLVLDYLEDQMKNGVDTELLAELGWSKEQLADFLNRWKQLRDQAEDSNSDDKDKRRYWEALRNIDLPTGTNDLRRPDDVTETTRLQSSQGAKIPPPPAVKNRYRAFTQGISRTQ